VTEDERLAERARRIHGDNPFSPENMAHDSKLKGIERDAVPIERTIEALKRHQEEDE
jgi:DNA-binding ferritin-like protein